eukprot:jgi/Botrbrau1/13789/Bobra.0056s0039.1
MDPSRSQAVETFTSVTGADVETAEHVLDAHGWDLDRGVTYYLERGSTFTAAPVAPGLEEPVNLATVEPPLSDGPSGVADNEAFTATEPWNMDAEDIDLQQVIAISLSAAGAGGTRTQPDRRGNHSEEAIEVSIDSDSDSERRNGTNDEDIEELRTLAQHRDQRQPREEALLDNFEVRRRIGESIDGVRSRRFRPPSPHNAELAWPGMGFSSREPDVARLRSRADVTLPFGASLSIPNSGTMGPPFGRAHPPLFSGAAAEVEYPAGSDLESEGDDTLDHRDDDMDWTNNDERGRPVRPGMGRVGAPEPRVNPPLGTDGEDYEHIDLPEGVEGVDIEEQRMMHALFSGTPYAGRFAQFPAPRPPPVVQPLSPTVAAQRRVREEQDAAYQASLLADRERQEAAHKAAEEAEAAKLAQEQARREAEDAAAAEQAAYEEELALKASNLPSEPPQAAADVVNVVVRFPNGRRVGRRFCKSNAIASLFDYVDVEARPDVKPRTYNLVTQFPRRVIAHDQPGSLDAAGLTHGQEALFIELV